MIYRGPGSLAVPLPSVCSTGDTQEGGERKRDNLVTGEVKGVGEEPNHTTAIKPVPLYIIQCSLVYSILHTSLFAQPTPLPACK
jgi:hypothetical protein